MTALSMEDFPSCCGAVIIYGLSPTWNRLQKKPEAFVSELQAKGKFYNLNFVILNAQQEVLFGKYVKEAGYRNYRIPTPVNKNSGLKLFTYIKVR